MDKLEQLMALADEYVNESVFIACGHPDASQIAADEALDALESALKAVLEDAERFQWLLDGNGYYMEEQGLCGYPPTSDSDKNDARRMIDVARKA